MEEDRAQTDLGIAADIEEAQNQAAYASPTQQIDAEQTPPGDENVVKQPKKRFVGRRAASEAATKNASAGTEGGSGAVQRESVLLFKGIHLIRLISLTLSRRGEAKETSSSTQSGPQGDSRGPKS